MSPSKLKKEKKVVVVGVTGSIAAFKAASLVSGLVREGCAVHVVMTKEAKHFITPLTFQMLSGNKVSSEMFETPEAWEVEHVALADAADLVVIAPATASIIGKLAGGICDDLLTCVVMATKAKVLIAPAMNDGMYAHPATQNNIERLKKMRVRFIGPDKGRLACGREAVGRMSAPEDIVRTALDWIG
jgi:phosphopantothenoylcysteine synthetase/decarboxylase